MISNVSSAVFLHKRRRIGASYMYPSLHKKFICTIYIHKYTQISRRITCEITATCPKETRFRCLHFFFRSRTDDLQTENLFGDTEIMVLTYEVTRNCSALLIYSIDTATLKFTTSDHCLSFTRLWRYLFPRNLKETNNTRSYACGFGLFSDPYGTIQHRRKKAFSFLAESRVVHVSNSMLWY